MEQTRETFEQWLETIGRLHDVRITSLCWRPTAQEVEMALDDFYYGIEGLPGYPGPEDGRLLFSGVTDFNLTAEHMDMLWIMECSCEPEERFEMSFDAGDVLSFKFGAVSFPPAVLI